MKKKIFIIIVVLISTDLAYGGAWDNKQLGEFFTRQVEKLEKDISTAKENYSNLREIAVDIEKERDFLKKKISKIEEMKKLRMY